jgi:hypothetical protein
MPLALPPQSGRGTAGETTSLSSLQAHGIQLANAG